MKSQQTRRELPALAWALAKEPFDGNAYESNSRYFRGTGKGESSKENIAYGKADMNAKSELAGQVNTTMRQVADQYLNEAANADASEVMEQFESLTRQVMNTQIADLRKIGEKKFFRILLPHPLS